MTYDDWKLRSDRDDAPEPEPASWCSKCEHHQCECPCCNETPACARCVDRGAISYDSAGETAQDCPDCAGRPDA